MKKKIKKLSDLKVQSFVTHHVSRIKGGNDGSLNSGKCGDNYTQYCTVDNVGCHTENETDCGGGSISNPSQIFLC